MCSACAERDVPFGRDVCFASDVRFAREEAEHITSLCDEVAIHHYGEAITSLRQRRNFTFSSLQNKPTDRFEPPRCRGRRLDDPKNTVQTGCRGRQPLPFKIYVQSHRCKGILDRFELAKWLKRLQLCGY